MKAARCKYIQAGTELSVSVYFDLKVFEWINPPLNKTEEEDFIRLICDSLAAILPTEHTERNFYIKRVLRYPATNTLTLLCTDGFLIDNALIVPISQQAFSHERIQLSEVEQLPSRLKLRSEILKNMSDRLASFEEQAKKDFDYSKPIETKAPIRQEKTTVTTTREFVSDKAIDVLSEIGNIKKEIKEIAKNSNKVLNSLMEKIDHIRDHIFNEIMQETKNELQYQDNKKKLDEFAQHSITQFGGGNIEKTTQYLKQKIEEISSIPSKFENEIEEISQHIVKQMEILASFKLHLINVLYDAAKQYSSELLKQAQAANPHARKTLFNEFNKKFSPVAAFTESGELTPLEEAQEKLGLLSLENLQAIVSNEDKDNPGILQKCNTSWTEESPELQIVMKNLGQLNHIYANLFKDNPQYAHYAKMDMIEIIRIPFPRSFHFKFSTTAMGYKKSVEDFCKAQKDTIISMSKAYKRTLQIDDIQDKTQRALIEVQKQTELMKGPIAEFRDLLKRKETSGEIMTLANKDHQLILQSIDAAKQLQETANVNIDANLKMLRRKINMLVDETQFKAKAASKIMQQMVDIKTQIDLAINNFSPRQTEKPNVRDLDEKIKSMKEIYDQLAKESRVLQTLNHKIAAYENTITISKNMTSPIVQSHVKTQRNEAKSLLLQLIKNPSGDAALIDQFKKRMIEVYANIDSNALNIDKIILELSELKKELLADLNSKLDISTQQITQKLQGITEKLQALESEKNAMNHHLSDLRKLSLESTIEKK
ncbi:MAG: hypothetical protein KIT56_05355 [Gammaproteobacteria bacterium]|nr:hypothetical protein [Gammaproteobacteria bacterium]MCW5583301.1 hypothetical protein [Gammaproteobacteria bacterium]